MPRRRTFSTEQVSALMTKHNGDYAKVGEELGITADQVRRRIYRDPRLKAVWVTAGNQGHKLSETELMVRDETIEPPAGEFLKALEKNGKEAFMNDIETMLHNPANAEKLQIFKEFDDSVGQYMGEGLKLTQKMGIRQNVSLFEMSEKLSDDIHGGALDAEEEILKMRLYMQATEQQGKFYDRILHGLDLMLKMTEREKGDKKRKAGFRPLKEKDDGENQED